MDATAIQLPSNGSSVAGAAFDQLAAEYDQNFTDSIVGRAQRDAVWKILTNTFKVNDNILELNCGTGADAIFLAGKGVSVFACDASQQMIARAEGRLCHESPTLSVVFCHLQTERIGELRPAVHFDGAFSNFSGLNCIEDLGGVASSLSDLVNDGSLLLLCFSTRFCLIEMLYYLIRGEWKKAFRRCTGHTMAKVGNLQLPVHYPTLRQIRGYFAPQFKLRSFTGVGVAVPPSYCENWARRHPHAFHLLCRLERVLAGIPILRVTGDHMLLCFEKVSK